MDLDRDWHRFADMLAVALSRGWQIDVGRWQDKNAAVELARGLFELYDVAPGKVLFFPIGTTPEGRDAVLALSNVGYTGCMMIRDGVPWWIGSFKEAYDLRATESVNQYDGRKEVGSRRSDDIPRGTRCFGTVGKGEAILCIAAGDGLIQTKMGGELVPWRDLVSSLTAIEGRDGAFDARWREGRTQAKGYRGLLGPLAARQRKINGQPMNEKTKPSPSLGPARIILPGESYTAVSAPENRVSVDVAPVGGHQAANVVPFPVKTEALETWPAPPDPLPDGSGRPAQMGKNEDWTAHGRRLIARLRADECGEEHCEYMAKKFGYPWPCE